MAQAFLLDHEAAHWGQPAFDVAFVLTHLSLKALHFRAVAFVDAAFALLAAYRSASTVAADATGELCGALLGALLLARIDGKSPVEYLAVDEQARVRALSTAFLGRTADVGSVLDLVRGAAIDA